MTVAQNFWNGARSIERDGVRVVRCPEEYNPAISCVNCGGVSGPLCARSDRNYIIGFTAHGGSKNKINRGERGGCYANGGNVNIHWERLTQKQQDKTDAEILRILRNLSNAGFFYGACNYILYCLILGTARRIYGVKKL